MNLHSDSRAIQKAFRQFAQTDSWYAPHGVTLTLKQGLPIDAARGVGHQRLTPEAASTNLRHYLNRLNQHVYGTAARRHGKRVGVIPILEGDGVKRLHYHLVIDCPREDLRADYPRLLTQLWQDTPWGYKINHVQADIDVGWTKYISKLRDKPNFADAIDWANYHSIDRRD